ncbi:Stage IV sporulation protein FB [Paraliobacillus sp. PM-2]|uniref:site-2 protease family protein n=1 Tax=Paraliobacillus sp. PM-2 TaxID=1462524 RepID=UPI00061CAE6C|nr:site-2 protease family protein [Paraliobacillus sp. PM-2]CQR48002.1 Stage IV sporulation protein FB [Paraliobacillus sp. PM-2]
MMLRNYLPPIVIHPTLWFSLTVSLLTGTIMEFLLVFSIVCIHESGHFFAATFFRWKIRKVMLWMFGGVMETDEYANRPLHEEIMITLAGPLQHCGIFFLLQGMEHLSLLSPSLLAMAYQFNWTILLFNLLPIFPLDGGKLLLTILSFRYPFRKAHTMTIITSVSFTLALIGFMLYQQEVAFSTYLLFTFILWENRLEWKQRFYVFMRFLLNRQQALSFNQKKRPILVPTQTKLIDLFSQFHRGYQHDIYVQHSLNTTDERQCLYTYFTLKQYQATVEDVCKN